MEPGIYDDISNNDYHKGPGVSSSNLKDWYTSPQLAMYRKEFPVKPVPAFIIGNVVHTLVLEPFKFEAEYMTVDSSTRTTKKFQQAVKDNPSKTVITENELDACADMAAAVVACPQVRDCGLIDGPRIDLLDGAQREASIYWKEGDTLCKARPDLWLQYSAFDIIPDLKTSVSAAPESFTRDIFKYKYDLSAAWYARGVEAVTGRNVGAFLWIVVEKTPPHVVTVFQAQKDVMLHGDMLCNKALAQLRRCESTGVYPGYAEETVPVSLPGYLGTN